jgi:hypothetical protein
MHNGIGAAAKGAERVALETAKRREQSGIVAVYAFFGSNQFVRIPD